jgi:sigma-B regulation protein RsbU (phosphoserine phosphatase)
MFRSLTTRLIVWSLALTGVVYMTVIGLSNRVGRATAIAAAEREANNDTDAAVFAVEDVLDTVEESTAALARAVSELQPAPDALQRMVQRFSADKADTVARYTVLLGDEDGRPLPDWYRDARERSAFGWTEPYRDPDLHHGTVITFVMPVRSPGGALAGAAAASLRLDFLSQVVREVHLGASGFALVLTKGGLLVAHTRRDLSDGTFDPLADLSPALRAVVQPVVQRAASGESGFAAVPFDGRVFRLTFRPIEGTGWFLATAYAEDELLADVASLQRTQIVLAGSGLLILALTIVLLSRRITGPLAALAAGAGRLATGDLDGPLPEAASRDEVGALTTAFHNMRDSLKEYIHTLQETTAAKERLEGEMKAARRIQADMLPSPTGGSPSAGFDLAAVLEPARDVGGDLFDHFQHDNRVFFLVGDVSGKGVAAALFMARAKTLFDAVAATEGDPGAVLATLNRGLCRQNAAGMYVTAVCGVLDLQTRAVTFATAGHEPPILVRTNGQAAPLDTEGGRVLGLLEFGDYPISTMTLIPGEMLVMYTDGVTDARNPNGEFFGPERLLATLALVASDTAEVATNTIVREVRRFTSTTPQFDDITVLTLRLRP